MDGFSITEIIGVAGIVLAALLSSLGYLYRNALERKKSAKRLLFVLLEVRHSIIASLFDPDEATEKYLVHAMEKMRDIAPLSSIEELPQVYRDMITGHFRNVMDIVSQDIEAVLLPQFNEALLSVSEVNPVLSYSLCGRLKFKELVESTNSYQKEFLDLFKDRNGNAKGVDEILKFSYRSKEKTFSEIAALIDEDVIRVAKFCGLKYWLRCRSILKKGVTNENKYDFSELDEMFEEYMRIVSLLGLSEG